MKPTPKQKTAMRVETVKMSDIKPHPKNPRKHPEENLIALVKSLQQYGQQKPIVINRKGFILAGHGQYEAATRLGWTTINVYRSDLNDRQQFEYMIADNKTGELSEWDFACLRDIMESDRKIEFIGFSEQEFNVFDSTALLKNDAPLVDVPDRHGILIECKTEREQTKMLERFSKEGLSCRAYTY